MDKTYRITLAYHGGAFSGFQYQENAHTVELELSLALKKLAVGNFSIQVAGRTDAGVHAKAQVVSVNMVTKIPLAKLPLALQAHLSPMICISKVDVLPSGFNAQKHSIGKRYLYQIDQNLNKSPFLKDTAWHVRKKLDVLAMQKASQYFLDERDFSAFRSVHCSASHARRYLWQVEVAPKNDGRITIDIRGNAFCHNMVRIMVGTLVEVGFGKISPDAIPAILSQKDRSLAGPTAKPHGLFLAEVYYPDNFQHAQIPKNAVFPRYPVSKESWPFDKKDIIYGKNICNR